MKHYDVAGTTVEKGCLVHGFVKDTKKVVVGKVQAVASDGSIEVMDHKGKLRVCFAGRYLVKKRSQAVFDPDHDEEDRAGEVVYRRGLCPENPSHGRLLDIPNSGGKWYCPHADHHTVKLRKGQKLEAPGVFTHDEAFPRDREGARA